MEKNKRNKASKFIDLKNLGSVEYMQEKVQADGSVKRIKTTVAKAFWANKKRLISAPVLAIPVLNKPFHVHTDASIVGTGGVLMQDGCLVAYTSTKVSPAEFNYTTVWRCYLEGAVECKLITDHHPLTHLRTQPNLSRRQARWMEFLSCFPFVIKYAKGETNVADPVSRNSLMYDPATPETVTCVGALGVVAAIMTRGQKRALGLGRSAGEQLPPPPGASKSGEVPTEMMLQRQPLILGSPRARALSVDPPTHSPPLTTGSQAHSGGSEQLGGGEEPTPPIPGTPGCGQRANSSCQVKEDIQAAHQSDPLFSRRKCTRGLERRDGIWYYKGRVVVPNS
eukprot:1138727-Pelagomonas_calceolata.AAC.1